MRKKELLARIEKLEARLKKLEAENGYQRFKHPQHYSTPYIPVAWVSPDPSPLVTTITCSSN